MIILVLYQCTKLQDEKSQTQETSMSFSLLERSTHSTTGYSLSLNFTTILPSHPFSALSLGSQQCLWLAQTPEQWFSTSATFGTFPEVYTNLGAQGKSQINEVSISKFRAGRQASSRWLLHAAKVDNSCSRRPVPSQPGTSLGPQTYTSPVAQMAKTACSTRDPSSIPGWGRSRGEGNGYPLHSLAWRIPWIEKPVRLPSMGSWRVGDTERLALSLSTTLGHKPELGACSDRRDQNGEESDLWQKDTCKGHQVRCLKYPRFCQAWEETIPFCLLCIAIKQYELERKRNGVQLKLYSTFV